MDELCEITRKTPEDDIDEIVDLVAKGQNVQQDVAEQFIRVNHPPPEGTSSAPPKPRGSTVQMAQVMMMQHDAIPPAKYCSMKEMTEDFWKERKRKMSKIPEEEMKTKTRNMSVPMARVKKIMRIDDDVRNYMISSDAPIFMAQAAEFFIEEMTAMGWQYVSEARRRILQKADIATAVQTNDQFDFLIDFLPPKQNRATMSSSQNPGTSGTSNNHRNAPTNFSQNGRASNVRKPVSTSPNNHQPESQHPANELPRQPEYEATSAQPGPSTSMPSTSSADYNFTAPTPPATVISHQTTNGSSS